MLPATLVLGLAGGAAGQAPGADAPGPPQPPARSQNVIAATVNGEPIRLDEVDAFIQSKLAVTPLTAPELRRLRTEVVSDMIDDVLLRQFLRQHGPKVEPAELDRHMAALASSLRRQGKTLDEYYRASGRTAEQVRDNWMTLIQYQRYIDQHATDEQLRKYHEAHRDLFDQTQVRASHIVLRLAPTASPTERAAARQKLAALRTEILAGKQTFADAARKLSMSPTAPRGGDLGFVSRRDPAVSDAVAQAAFTLKVGEVSEPTDDEFGIHLVQATERKAGTPSTFDKVADLVRECYAEEVRQGLVGQLRKQAKIEATIP